MKMKVFFVVILLTFFSCSAKTIGVDSDISDWEDIRPLTLDSLEKNNHSD